MLFSISRRPRNVRDQYRTSPRGILNLRWEEVDLENAVVKMRCGRIGACLKAGLDPRLTRNGADLVTVKELLGHSSVSEPRSQEAAGSKSCSDTSANFTNLSK